MPATIASVGGERVAATHGARCAPARLRDRRLLLIAGQLRGICSYRLKSVAELPGAARSLKVLATNYEPLRLYGEHVYRDAPERCRMSITGSRRKQQAASECVQLIAPKPLHHDFALDSATIVPVVEMGRQLDGLPLAIELAAARLRHFTAPELLRRLTANDSGGDRKSAGLAVL